MLELYLQAKNFIYDVGDFFNEQHVKKYLNKNILFYMPARLA